MSSALSLPSPNSLHRPTASVRFYRPGPPVCRSVVRFTGYGLRNGQKKFSGRNIGRKTGVRRRRPRDDTNLSKRFVPGFRRRRRRINCVTSHVTAARSRSYARRRRRINGWCPVYVNQSHRWPRSAFFFHAFRKKTQRCTAAILWVSRMALTCSKCSACNTRSYDGEMRADNNTTAFTMIWLCCRAKNVSRINGTKRRNAFRRRHMQKVFTKYRFIGISGKIIIA